MKNPLYLRQLRKDIARWVEMGLIDNVQADGMLRNAGTGASIQSFASLIAVLGVILLGASAISFVAANFWSFPKILQIGLLFSLMWAAFAAGWALLSAHRTIFGHCAYLLGATLFGVNMMLIGQIYHINAHWPAGILIWALGALATGIVVPSAMGIALALVLGTLWTGSESFAFDEAFHWPFLIFWSIAAILALRLKSDIGFHLSVLSMVFWLIANSYQVSRLLGWQAGELVGFFCVFWICVWPLGAILQQRRFSHAGALTNYVILFFFIAFYLLHVITENDLGDGAASWLAVMAGLGAATVGLSAYAVVRKAFSPLDAGVVIAVMIAALSYPTLYPAAPVLTEWLYRALFMIFCIWAVDRGMRTQNQVLINLALVAFGIEIVYIYFGKFSSFMGDAMFFFIGGVVLIGVSFGLDRLRRRLLNSAPPTPPQTQETPDAAKSGEIVP